MRASALLRAIATGALVALSGGARPSASTVDVMAWTLIYNRPATGKYEDFAWVSDHEGWLITARGDILHTTNSGVNWTSQAHGYLGLRSIDFWDNKHGFAGTLTGKLYATTDGGDTWIDIAQTLPHLAKGFC